MIHMTYTNEDGLKGEYELADDQLDPVLALTDAKFCQPWTAHDERNFQRIMADDEIRRNPEGGRKGHRKAQDRAEGSRRGKGKDRATERT